MIFLWIVMYGITYTLSERLSAYWQLGHGITIIALGVYLTALLLYLKKHNKCSQYGVCNISGVRLQDIWYLLPMLGFPIVNVFISSKTANCGQSWDIYMLMFITVFLEELCFRGLLPVILLQKKYTASFWGAVVISNAMFAVYHLVNLWKGADWRYTLVQALCAFGVGMCLSVILIRWHSLFPGIGIHYLINITSLECDISGFSLLTIYILLAVCYMGYAHILIFMDKRT